MDNLMCFSPTASFGAGLVLAATGVVALSRSRTIPQRTLAFIPLLFALQQCSEGLVWLSLMRPQWAVYKQAATYVFLFFAQIAWPVYIPLCAFVAEPDKRRRSLIGLTWITGIGLAAYTGVQLILHRPEAIAGQRHIRYEFNFRLTLTWYYGILYFVPTILALLLSSRKSMHWLGYLFFFSYLGTRLLFRLYVISVWCFFGAMISLVVVVVIRNDHQNSPREHHDL